MDPFEKFAPTVLEVYRRDKEAFWKALYAPFMSDKPLLLSICSHLKTYKDLLPAIQGMNAEAEKILKAFGKPFGQDLTKWKSSLYFKDFYSVFAFLVIWLEEQGLSGILPSFGGVLRSAVYGTTGYGVLDVNLDGNNPSPEQILTAQALIAEYEAQLLQAFGVTETNLKILHRMRARFYAAEIREKTVRWKSSPYQIEHPEDSGAKAAHALTPFMLGLEQAGNAALIDDYWEACMLFSGVVQILDDWADLEQDLEHGHYSYVTLGLENLYNQMNAREAARQIRAEKMQTLEIYRRGKEQLGWSRSIFEAAGDQCLARFVDIIGLRLESYCRKKLKLEISPKEVCVSANCTA